jgi:hypothetical protein
MTEQPQAPEERVALKLSMREWLLVALVVTAVVAVAPFIPFRARAPKIEKDYRIPYALSARYEIYRRFTALSAKQYPTLLVGDSVLWGQCAPRDQTLSHHLNELTKQPRFANAGLDAMHPLALEALLEHHAPAIERKDVVLHFDPLWLMMERDEPPKTLRGVLFHRPGLVPRLAADFSSALKKGINEAGAMLVRRSPLAGWAERFSDTRLDFLAWSLDHPYESPLQAISAALPPSEDSHPLRLTPWNGTPDAMLDMTWPVLEEHPQWAAFERILDLLHVRSNRVLVLIGPMNEPMMRPAMRVGYQTLKQTVQERLKARGVRTYLAPALPTELFTDICHPLGAGYELLARDFLKAESSWLLGTSGDGK